MMIITINYYHYPEPGHAGFDRCFEPNMSQLQHCDFLVNALSRGIKITCHCFIAEIIPNHCYHKIANMPHCFM